MKLICDGVEFPSEVSEQKLSTAEGDNEVPVFQATAKAPFSCEAKWELEDNGKRVELSIRKESVAAAPSAGGYCAVFTAPAVG